MAIRNVVLTRFLTQRALISIFYPGYIVKLTKKKFCKKKIFPCQIVKKTPMKIFLDTYLKSRKWHFLRAWKTLIVGTLWGQNSPIGVIDCAESEFDVKNCISPLFGVVRDLENRQKSAIFKIGLKRPKSHFWLIFG